MKKPLRHLPSFPTQLLSQFCSPWRFIVAFGFLCLCTSCNKQPKALAQEKNQMIKVNLSSEPQTLDPRKVRSLNDINLVRQVMEGLYREDEKGNISAALAEKVEKSEDHKTYRFLLRECYWSNGGPITSHDFLYTWKKTLSPDFPSQNAHQLFVIKNAKLVKQGKLPPSLLGVHLINDREFTIELEAPLLHFERLLVFPCFFPINHQVDTENPQWSLNAETYVSSGPFMLLDWNHQDCISLVKNPKYWDKDAVQLQEVKMTMLSEETEYRLFETGDLDWAGSPLSSLSLDTIHALQDQPILKKTPALATCMLRVNTKHPFLQSSKIRRALAYALNRTQLVQHMMQGSQSPALSFVPPSLRETDQAGYFEDANIPLAQTLLEEGLNELNITKEEFQFHLSFTPTEKNKLLSQALQDQWKSALGIQVQLETVEEKVFFDHLNKNHYDLACGSWFADAADPMNFLNLFKDASMSTNNTGWENPRYTSLLETAYHCLDATLRNKTLNEAESLLMEEMPIIPIFHYSLMHVQKSNIHNVMINPLGLIDFKWAKVE